MNNNISKNLIIWAAGFAIILIIVNVLQSDNLAGNGSRKMAMSEFLGNVEENKVDTVFIKDNIIEGKLTDGTKFTTFGSSRYPGLIDVLSKNKVHFDVVEPNTQFGEIIKVLLSWFPFLMLVGVWVFFMRQMQGGGGKAMGFGKSKAKLLSQSGTKVTFKDVAGIEEAKEELAEIVDFLRDPGKFQKLGGSIPKGCLLIGPPGTGKTLLAKAIAGEANVPFFSISGSDFVEMFVGVGASRVRDMFEQGKKNAPCIIFIDEIDAVGRHRGIGLGGGNDEREQTLNQMLVEMDGFEANDGVIIIAATNRPDVLDPALLRPGRFDRQITVPNPDIDGREKILEVHLKKIKHDDSVNTRILARGTPGFAGADLANMVNEAALLAARKGKKLVEMKDLEEAKDKVMMGAERKSMAMSEDMKKLTAYHEGGHAIVSIHSPASDPIHKATIIPRGRALGMVMRLPENDRYSLSREKMEADIAVAMGGRVAEEEIFGSAKVTSGASSDIKMATQMARSMVMEWGLSDKVGTIYYQGGREDAYSMREDVKHSEQTAQIIDQEVKRIVEEGRLRAKKIITENINALHKLAEALLVHETLSGDQIKNILAGRNIDHEIEEKPAKKVSAKKAEAAQEVAENPKKVVKPTKAKEEKKEEK